MGGLRLIAAARSFIVIGAGALGRHFFLVPIQATV